MDDIGGERVAAASHPHSMFFIKANVAYEADWENLIKNTLDKWGRVDILVNNAGTSYKNKVRWSDDQEVFFLSGFKTRKSSANVVNSQRQKSQRMSLTKSLTWIWRASSILYAISSLISSTKAKEDRLSTLPQLEPQGLDQDWSGTMLPKLLWRTSVSNFLLIGPSKDYLSNI